MRHFSSLVVALAVLLPLTVFAASTASPSSASTPSSQPHSQPLLNDYGNNRDHDREPTDFSTTSHLLDPRQDLTSLIPILPVLADVLTRMQRILLLLKAQFFQDVATLISGLADLMEAPLPAQLRGLVNTATDLLGGLGPVLRFIGKIDFESITDSLQALFEPAFVAGRVQLVKDVSRLVTADVVREFVKVVQDIGPVSLVFSSLSLFLSSVFTHYYFSYSFFLAPLFVLTFCMVLSVFPSQPWIPLNSFPYCIPSLFLHFMFNRPCPTRSYLALQSISSTPPTPRPNNSTPQRNITNCSLPPNHSLYQRHRSSSRP